MIGLEGESTRTIEKVPANQLSHDSFREAVVETKPLSDDRSAYRGRRAKNDGDHPPLRPVELDVNSEILEPVSANLSCVARNDLGRHGVMVGEAAVPGFCLRRVRCESLSHNFIIAWSSTLP